MSADVVAINVGITFSPTIDFTGIPEGTVVYVSAYEVDTEQVFNNCQDAYCVSGGEQTYPIKLNTTDDTSFYVVAHCEIDNQAYYGRTEPLTAVEVFQNHSTISVGMFPALAFISNPVDNGVISYA